MRKLAIAVVALFLSVAARGQVTPIDMATDTSDPNNEFDAEPSIAINPLQPKQMTVLTFSETWRDKKVKTKIVPLPLWETNSGGSVWAKNRVIPAPNPQATRSWDQTAIYDANGVLHLVETSDTKNPHCYVYTETAPGTFIHGPAFGNDQPHIAIRGSNLFVAWVDVFQHHEQKDRSHVTTTDDKGNLVADVLLGPASKATRTTRVAVSSKGVIYVVYKVHLEKKPNDKVTNGLEKVQYYVAKSTDGKSWNLPGVPIVNGAITWFTARWGNSKNLGAFGRARSSDAWIATNPTTGEVWTAYCDKVNGFVQIFLKHSPDGVNKWSPPIRVTDGTRNSAFPEVAVAANGTIGVLYADFDPSGSMTVYTHTLARSFDGGKSWSMDKLDDLTTQGFPVVWKYFLWGDYEALTAAGNTFYGVFCGKDKGRSMPQFDPLFFTAPATP
jgi:hypothetical protein